MAKGFYHRSGAFSLSLEKFARGVAEREDQIVRKIVIDMGTRIVERSPVGDGSLWKRPPPPGYVGGRFRANWQYGNNLVGVPTAELPDIDASGNASITRILQGLPEKAGGLLHTLINNLPYGQPLEDGWSKQAPAGMVHVTVIEFQQIVREAVVTK